MDSGLLQRLSVSTSPIKPVTMADKVRKEGWDAMNTFEHKTFSTKPYDLTYSYYLDPDFYGKVKPGTPTLMFLHGFPDDAYMWAGLLPTLLKLPNPLIIPDLLGFAGSSKPTDPERYRWRQQADSLVQILAHEGVHNNIIPIGHDWGSGVAQRFYVFHPERCVGLAPFSLPYFVPSSEPFNLAAANRRGIQKLGYPHLEYWNLFMADDGPELVEKNLERFYEVLHGLYPSPVPGEEGIDIWMREMFCVPNAMREYLTGKGKYEVSS